MLHAKVQGDRLCGSGVEDCFNDFTIYGHDDHHGHVTWTKYICFFPGLPEGFV